MKRQSREFVVEYKAPKRQLKSNSKSIWGSLDLAAISKAVSDDVQAAPPILPDVNVEHGSAADVVPTLADLFNEGLSSAVESNERLVTSPSSGKLVAAESVCETVGVATGRTSAAKAKASRKPGSRARGTTHQESSDKEPVTEVMDDDLDLLSAENIRLRTLLREKLEVENELLMAMIRRYVVR